MDQTRGDFIDNTWIRPTGPDVIRSINPATDNEIVAEARVDVAHAALAVEAARRAGPGWAGLTVDERLAALRRFARELAPRSETLARAITREIGKPIRESRAEAQSLIDRVDLVADHQLPQVRAWTPAGVDGECRYHPLGVVGIIGPFNFPLHLLHAHLVPALATGNTVVIKPSERAPLAAQHYIEALAAANLPPVVQLLQGGPDVGRALVATPGLSGLTFTGSWRAGHAIERALVDRPEVLAALEMGGQNVAIVLADADLDQALEGVLLGAYLTAGQRCTRTARVLVERKVAGPFLARLAAGARELTLGDPLGDAFMGPMASVADRLRLDALCEAGVRAGAEPVLAGARRPGGAWRTPSLHRITAHHDSEYTREEVFGPDLAFTEVDDLDEALAIVAQSPYGLAVSLFTARRAALERVYQHTRVGCVNWNRSTNRASSVMPFGGVGRSGNHRPAGSDAVRNTTYPVQVLWSEVGVLEGDPYVRAAVHRSDPVAALEALHRLEECCEPYGLYPLIDGDGAVRLPLAQLDRGVDLARPLLDALRERKVDADLGERELRLRLPAGSSGARGLASALADALHAVRALHPTRFLGRRPVSARPPADPPTTPRSEALLRRIGLPPEAGPVVDIARSAGHWLASVDDPPRFVPPTGPADPGAHALNASATLAGLWDGRFGSAVLDDAPSQANTTPEARRLTARLRAAGPHPWVALTASRALAVELALAACATRRPGRRATVVFAGADPGATLLTARLAVPAPDEDGADAPGGVVANDDARAVVWPSWDGAPAPEPPGWLERWSARDAAGAIATSDDPQLARELAALLAVESALADDRALAVLIAPGPPGQRHHGSPRWLRALRALTTTWDTPLVLDASRADGSSPDSRGLGAVAALTRDWPDPPDLVTCARPWELGFVLSRWPLPEGDPVATASIARSILHAESPPPPSDAPAPPVAPDEGTTRWPATPSTLPGGYRLVRVNAANWPTLRGPWEALRRTAGGEPGPAPSALDVLLDDPGAIAVAAVHGAEFPPRGKLVGAIFGVPLEHLGDRSGPDRDPALGRGDTLFALDLAVAGDHRRQGLGHALEHALVTAAMTSTRPDGAPRYAYLTASESASAGEQRATRAHLYGAAAIHNPASSNTDYPAPAKYYRTALCAPRLPEAAALPTRPAGRPYDLAPGLGRRLGDPRDRGEGVAELVEAVHAGRLNDALINAASPAFALTPAVIRAVELLRALAPKGLGRLQLAPSRSALCDVALMALGRGATDPVLALGPVDAGHGSAAARSISLPATAPDNPWRWPTLADPSVDAERALAELRRELTQRGGARVQAVAVEAVYARTGRAVPDALWRPLRALCHEHDVPLLLFEDTTAGFRSGRGMWRADTLPIQPDAVLWSPAAQLGLAFLRDDAAAVADGALGDADVLALTRLAWELRVIRNLPIAHRAVALGRALAPIGAVHGEGLYRTVTTPHAAIIARRLTERGLQADVLGDDLVRFAPPLNVPSDTLERLGAALRELAP